MSHLYDIHMTDWDRRQRKRETIYNYERGRERETERGRERETERGDLCVGGINGIEMEFW